MDRGFSLIEVLVATTVTTIGTLALAQLCVMSMRMNQDARATTLATVLASQKMEQLRALAWTSDALGVPISDLATDTTVVPHSSSGGTGLSASPSGTLGMNTPGYCDFLDENGRTLGGGTAPPAGTAFVRRWSIAPGPPAASDTLAIQISVIRIGSRSRAGSTVRGPDEVRLLGNQNEKIGHARSRPAGGGLRAATTSGARTSAFLDVKRTRGSRCVPARCRSSIIEVLIAMGVALCVMASTLTMVSGLQRGFAGEGERADMQQRVRAASDALYRDLVMAGAGAYQGAHSGPLDFFVASVMPFRQGAIGADPPGTFKSNTITVVYLSPAAAPQTTIRQPLPAQSSSALLNVDVGCPPADPVCGFAAGMDVMVYDETASYDTFRITSAEGGMLQLQHTMVDTPQSYAAGAKIVAAASHTYLPRRRTKPPAPIS